MAGGEECPEELAGITQSFPRFVSDTYATFVATNSIPLQAPGGGACSPFLDVLKGTDKEAAINYPEFNRPQCEGPSAERGFCAFVFEDGNDGFVDSSTCQGRRYAMQTFAEEFDVPATASITHEGPCGVCSSAADLSVRMQSRETLAGESFTCGLAFFTAGIGDDAWSVLVQCFENLGFSSGCAELWGHFTASNANLCGFECISPGGFNSDPPECSLNECLTCGVNSVTPEFDRIAGRKQTTSGITEVISRPCSEYYRVIHDPCPGQTAPPTVSPAPTISTTRSGASSPSNRLGTAAFAFALMTFVIGK